MQLSDWKTLNRLLFKRNSGAKKSVLKSRTSENIEKRRLNECNLKRKKKKNGKDRKGAILRFLWIVRSWKMLHENVRFIFVMLRSQQFFTRNLISNMQYSSILFRLCSTFYLHCQVRITSTLYVKLECNFCQVHLNPCTYPMIRSSHSNSVQMNGWLNWRGIEKWQKQPLTIAVDWYAAHQRCWSVWAHRRRNHLIVNYNGIGIRTPSTLLRSAWVLQLTREIKRK